MGRKALVVGINNYPSAPLNAPINDAMAMASLLKTDSDGSPNFAVKTMISPNEDIDRAKLKSQIDELFKGTPDIALLYFSGHGILTSTGGYIVTPDYKAYDEGVSMADILTYANGSNAINKVIILDCCYSGAMGEIKGAIHSQISTGLTIMTACKKSEPAYEKDNSSLFTSLVIDALQGGAADLGGNISPGSVYSYVDKSLSEWEQRPIFKTNVETFVSLRKVQPPISRDIIKRLVEFFPTQEDIHKMDPSYEFTNHPDYKPKDPVEPYANQTNVETMKQLQALVKVGLVKPEGEEHMYFAAIKSEGCKLTALGAHYWRLAKEGLI
jgi:hypothetical protein